MGLGLSTCNCICSLHIWAQGVGSQSFLSVWVRALFIVTQSLSPEKLCLGLGSRSGLFSLDRPFHRLLLLLLMMMKWCLKSSDVSWHIRDQCWSMVQYSFKSTETRILIRMDSPGRPPRLSHSSWTMNSQADDDEVMLNVLRCQLTY